MKKHYVILASIMLCSSLSAADRPKESLNNQVVGLSPHQGESLRAPNPPRQFSPKEAERLQALIHGETTAAISASSFISDSAKSVFSKSVFSKSGFSKSGSAKSGFSKSNNNKQAANPTSCTQPAELLNLNGQALVEAVKNAELTSCLYGLYNPSFVGTAHFNDAKLSTIVQAINALLPSYRGTTATGAAELEKLVTYLRAAHWAESSAGTSRQYTANYLASLQTAFDGYFGGEHFVIFNGNVSRNYMLRYEMLILVNSSNSDSLRYFSRFGQAIKGYATSVSRTDDWGVNYEEQGMTQLLTHYFNLVNSDKPEVQQQLIAQPEIINALRDFVTTDGTWLIGHTREYQWSDAVTELSRLLKFQGTIADNIRPTIQNILSNYSYGGVGSKGWVNAQQMVLNYDNAHCDSYGDACDFDLEAVVLSGNHICSESLKIRFQQPLSSDNLLKICSDLTLEEKYFHTRFNNPTPVANDNNTDLEVIIFNSSNEYKNYAGNFFNISTDNGGMYLEGTPSATNNQARFIAYQATWLPDFTVWNLEHEYVHYLDGRFNQWGSFSDQPENLVWWGEGIAEYLSLQDNNEKALLAAQDKTYSFSDLLQTTYSNGDTARVYYWGYLSVRFMFERHRDLIDDRLLTNMRAAKYAVSDAQCLFDWGWRSKTEATENNWFWLYDDSENASGNWVWTCGQDKTEIPSVPDFEPYADIITEWTGQFDAEFNEWLDCIIAGEDCTTNSVVELQNGIAVNVSGLKASEQHFNISLPANAYDLKITSNGNSGDLDMYVRQLGQASLTEWDFRPYWVGSKEHVHILQPENQLDVMLHGYSDYTNATLTATWLEGTLNQLQQWSGLSSSRNNVYQWVYIPLTAKAVYYTLDGGLGDAQLYVRRNGWPARNNYDAASTTTRGTTQKIKMENFVAGSYYHILVTTLEGFSDVNLKVLIVE